MSAMQAGPVALSGQRTVHQQGCSVIASGLRCGQLLAAGGVLALYAGQSD
jgi:hypothetical protein